MRSGTVIATHGRHHVILSAGATIQCVTRGKKTDIAVGDHVNFVPTSSNQGVIESTDERQTLLYRSDQYKSKFLAANVSQVMIVTATEPVFYDDLLSRALVAANAAGIKAHIILNKIDVSDHLSKTRSRLKIYGDLGYPIHEVSALTQSQATFDYLSPLLSNQST